MNYSLTNNEFAAHCMEYKHLCEVELWDDADYLLNLIADWVDDDYERLCPIMESFGITY